MARKDLLSRLADAGEEAIAKLADTPGADRMLGALTSLRERVDELQKRVRGLDELERRVAALERRLDEDATRKATAKRPRAAPKAAAKPKTPKAASPAPAPAENGGDTAGEHGASSGDDAAAS